jgi:hypothetical protein
MLFKNKSKVLQAASDGKLKTGTRVSVQRDEYKYLGFTEATVLVYGSPGYAVDVVFCFDRQDLDGTWDTSPNVVAEAVDGNRDMWRPGSRYWHVEDYDLVKIIEMDLDYLIQQVAIGNVDYKDALITKIREMQC